jgi:gluconolactonase
MKPSGMLVPRAGFKEQGSNGLTVDSQGRLLICQHGERRIARVEKDGTQTPLADRFEGKRFNSPNDLVVGPDGTLWFTDPTFSVPQGVTRELPFAGVYRYRAGVLTPVIQDMPLPNGIALSPDGKTLYVNNSRPSFVRAYALAADGSLSNMRELIRFEPDPNVRGVPDGMKVDVKGNLWTTGPGGAWILSPAGKKLGRIQLPRNCTNIAFGDADYRSAFFTCGPSVFRVRSLVAGEKPQYAMLATGKS